MGWTFVEKMLFLFRSYYQISSGIEFNEFELGRWTTYRCWPPWSLHLQGQILNLLYVVPDILLYWRPHMIVWSLFSLYMHSSGYTQNTWTSSTSRSLTLRRWVVTRVHGGLNGGGQWGLSPSAAGETKSGIILRGDQSLLCPKGPLPWKRSYKGPCQGGSGKGLKRETEENIWCKGGRSNAIIITFFFYMKGEHSSYYI